MKLKFLFLATESKELADLQAYIKSHKVDFISGDADRKPKIKKLLTETNWDIVFIDGSTNSFKVFDVLQLVKNNAPAIPVILFLDHLSENMVVEAMKMGASDLVLNNNLTRLIPAIHNSLQEKLNDTSLKNAKGMFAKYDFNFNTSNSFLSLIDRDYRYQAVNQVFRKLHNLSKNEITGRYLEDVWGKEKFEKFIKPNLEKCFNNSKIVYDAWFSTPTMGMRCFRVRYLPYRDDKGEITHAIIETKDITSERNIAERISKGERETLSVIEFSQDYFWSVDKELKLIFANRIFKESFNKKYHKKLLLNDLFLKNLSSEEQKIWTERYQYCLKGKSLSIEENLTFNKEPDEYFDITINPVKGNDNEIIGLTCLARNITARKLTEENNRRQKEDLNLFNKLNSAANSGKSYRAILGIIARETSKMFGGFGGVVYSLNEDMGYVESKGKFPVPKIILEELESLIKMKLYDTKIYIKGKDNHYSKVVKSKEPKLINTSGGIRDLFRLLWYPDLSENTWKEVRKAVDIKSVYSIPMISGDIILGVFDIYNQTSFSKKELTRIRNVAGQITAILQRKIDEEALRESENKFRHLFDSANDANLIMDGEAFVDCNNKTLEMFRCTRTDILGKTPFDFSPEYQPGGALSQKVAHKYIQRVYQGRAMRFEWVHARMDKTEFHTEISLNKIKVSDKPFVQVIIRDISIHKFTEQLVKESEQRFRAIFEDAPDAMVLADPESGYILNVNKLAITLLGKPKEEIIGSHFYNMHPENQKEMISRIFYKHSWNNKFNLDNLLHIKHSDGHIVPVEIQGKMISYGGRNVLQGAFRDVTQHVNNQLLIRNQTIDLSIINKLNSLANLNKSLDDILDYYSGQIEEKFGVGRFRLLLWDPKKHNFFFRYLSISKEMKITFSELLQKDINRIHYFPSGESQLFRKIKKNKPWFVLGEDNINKQISEIFGFSLSSEQPNKIRQLFEVKSLLNFPLFAGDELLGFVILASRELVLGKKVKRLSEIMENFTGILQRKKAEEEQAKLFSVMEQLSESVLISDLTGIIQYANPAYYKRTGFSVNEIVGSYFKDNWFKDKTELANEIIEILFKGEVWRGRLSSKTKDGGLYEGDVIITPIRDGKGKIINFAIMKRDITREAQLEAQLRQSHKLETVGTLAGGIAHDFNNILGTVIGYTDMMKDELPGDSIIQDYVTNMDKALIRAKGLVNQILTFSRKVEPETRLVDLKSLIEDSISLFSLSFNASSRIKIKTQLCDSCEEFMLDPSQIQQVILNLLTNAGQSLKNKNGIIDIHSSLISNNDDIRLVHKSLRAKKLIKFSVTDNGSGIKNEILERIFEPFFTTKSVNEGTGLGLSVVHGIVTAHGGVIEAKSQPGVQTSFTVYLPVV